MRLLRTTASIQVKIADEHLRVGLEYRARLGPPNRLPLKHNPRKREHEAELSYNRPNKKKAVRTHPEPCTNHLWNL